MHKRHLTVARLALFHPSQSSFACLAGTKYPNVCLSPTQEDPISEDALLLSKCNTPEAKFAVRLARYLAQQRGVAPESITLLSAYVSQVGVLYFLHLMF